MSPQNTVRANVDSDSEAVKFDDLDPTYQHIATIVGVEAALKLGAEFSGLSLYFPVIGRKSQHLRRTRDRRIIQEFDGTNVKSLAVKFHLSTTWIRLLTKMKRRSLSKKARIEPPTRPDQES
jgi:Mor family transcriptional regulator